MDKIVTAKFFRVSERDEGYLDFPEQIVDFIERNPVARDREFRANGKLIRLESEREDGDFLSGDFCRIQTDNIPPEVTNNGLQPVQLANNRGLGHQNAFLYHRPTRVLLWQSNRLGVTFNDLALYLNKDLQEVNFFSFPPVPSEEAWEKFNNHRPKKLQVKFAGELNPQIQAGEATPAVVRAREAVDRYQGLDVEITISVGKTNQRLNKHIVGDTIRRLIGRNDTSHVRVMTDGPLGEKMIDFLEEQLQNTDELELPSNDPATNYQVRNAFLRRSFDQRLASLMERFRTQP